MKDMKPFDAFACGSLAHGREEKKREDWRGGPAPPKEPDMKPMKAGKPSPPGFRSSWYKAPCAIDP
jgi:hypothetical protein